MESHEVGETLNSLGMVQLRRKNYTTAENSLRRSLAVMEKLYGPNQSDVGTVLNNLGAVLLTEKKYAEAERVLERSVRLHRANLAATDTRVADAVLNLAQLYIDLGRFVESEPLLKEVVAIRNTRGHRASAEDALAYERYASVLRRNGNTVDADDADAKAKSIRSELRFTFRP
jgi:tetratricopeptide (TPR) repeat protein